MSEQPIDYTALSPEGAITQRYWREYNGPFSYTEQRFREAWGLQPQHNGYQHWSTRSRPDQYFGPVMPTSAATPLGTYQAHVWPAFAPCVDKATCNFPHYEQQYEPTTVPVPDQTMQALDYAQNTRYRGLHGVEAAAPDLKKLGITLLLAGGVAFVALKWLKS